MKKVEGYGIESFVILAVFTITWLGYGQYMWGLLLLGFFGALFFKQKRIFLFRDKVLLVLIIALTINNIISSLFAIDNPKTTLLSAVWFLALFVPMSYVRFSLNKENDFFMKWVLPVSFIISLVILLYMYIFFLYHTATVGLEFKRYTFLTLGKASTPDFILLLGGLGYGWLRQKEGGRYKWFGLVYLLACLIGMLLAFDRGGVIAFLFMSVLLLSFDYKRLIVFFALAGAIVALILIVDAFEGLRRMIDYLYLEATHKELLESQQISTFRAGWEMALDHWLLGVGTNNFSKYSEQYGPKIWWTYAHNVVLQFWAENGIFGMLLNLTIIGVVIVRWVKSFKKYKYKYVALGIGASFIGLFIGNLTNCTIYVVKIGLLFYLLAGLMSSVYFAVKDEQSNVGTVRNSQQ
jgi:O-antigen ligase